MEGKGEICVDHGKGGGGDDEVRRIHIVYFLSRMGTIEHPHLINVQHLSQNGIHLRDVKRWLAELRGKSMPDSFSWSYKRRYKSGYIWQDLMDDDDLITPISDNEFVLKGCEIPAISIDSCTCGKKTGSDPKTSASSKTHVASSSRPNALNCLKTNNNNQRWTKELISVWADSCPCCKKTRSDSQTSASASSKTCEASRPSALNCLKTNNNYNKGRTEECQTREHARGMMLKPAKH